MKTALTVLSFGGGQDSTAILLKLINDPSWYAKYVSGRLIVVMADTGNEHDYTYKHVEKMYRLCFKADIPFYFISPNADRLDGLPVESGFHTPAWRDLLEVQERKRDSRFKKSLVMLRQKTCTNKLKIDPIYKFLDAWINREYGYDFPVDAATNACGKKAWRKFAEEEGRIRVLIGFAAGEDKRVNSSNKLAASIERRYHKERESGKVGPWEIFIDRVFPLHVEGMNRQACVDYIESTIGYEVMPSNCMLCPYQSLPELLWLHRNQPEQWERWVAIENDKLSRHKGEEKNFGVYASKKTLTEKLTEAQEKFGHLSQEELHQEKKYHGCQTNAF